MLTKKSKGPLGYFLECEKVRKINNAACVSLIISSLLTLRFSTEVIHLLVIERLDDHLEAVGTIKERVVNGVQRRVAQIDQSFGLGTFRILKVIQMLFRSIEHEVKVFPFFCLFIHFLVQEVEISSDNNLIVLLPYKVCLHFWDGFVDFDVLL